MPPGHDHPMPATSLPRASTSSTARRPVAWLVTDNLIRTYSQYQEITSTIETFALALASILRAAL